MVTVKDVVGVIEQFAPPVYQESYDNSGLQTGDFNARVNKILLAVDVTEPVIDEAIELGANLIISHHPVIFQGIKRITGRTFTERVIAKAIKNDINIYSCHTNIDNVFPGVNLKISEKIGLTDIQALKPMPGMLFKLVTFIPTDHLEKVRQAVFDAGAGTIGNYDFCSFNVAGNGTFRASDSTNPYVGEKNKLHTEPEVRVETIFPKHLEKKIISALIKAHPYEEVAYDIYPITNSTPNLGAGAIGHLQHEMDEKEFLASIKKTFRVSWIRHSPFVGRPIKKVAVCGGSGAFLLADAKREGADVFISADFKYHQFFDADDQILIADIGHFESEQYTLEIFYEVVTKKLPNFAIYFTKVKSNPINYI